MTLTKMIKFYELREREERRAANMANYQQLREILTVVADRYADLVWSLYESQFEQSRRPNVRPDIPEAMNFRLIDQDQ